MNAPASPSPSSTNSCLSDSETSNDSGIDSMAGGSLPPDYMDLDEFLVATGVELSVSQRVVSNRHWQGNKIAIEYESNTQSSSAKQNGYLESKSEEKTLPAKKSLKTNSARVQNFNKEDKDENDYNYKYNPVPMKRKASRQFVADMEKDDKYWKRRTRNNEAARRSRDMRRQREIEISTQCRELEKENARLRKELQKLKDKANELERQLTEKQN